MEIHDFHREDYYWAQLTAEVRKCWVRYPNKVKIKDFILDFRPVNKEDQQRRTDRSKNFWLGSLGYKGE